jgi:hypothetical protein
MGQTSTPVNANGKFLPNISLALLADASATGSAFDWPGGSGAFIVDRGTFSGATVKLQFSIDGGTTWLDVDQGGDTYVTLTTAGAGAFDLPACEIKAVVSGGTPSALYATAKGVSL